MAFKRARDVDLGCPNRLIDDSTEEILDYLLRSRSFLSDLTLRKLNQNLNQSLTKRLSNIFQNFLKNSKLGVKILVLFILCTMFISLFAESSNAATLRFILNQDKNDNSGHSEQKINNEFSLTNVVPVSEESKDNLSGIRPGQPLIIIPKGNRIHEVKKGEDLVQISSKYNVPIKELINANFRVDILNLKGGEKLVIPDVKTKTARNHRYQLASRGLSPSLGFSFDRNFQWPANGVYKISSRFGFRWNRIHEGIDIPGKIGTLIQASKPGIVEFAGWKGSYGKCVVVNHGDGIKTLYGHASALLVRTGDMVDVGQSIAKIGNTGRSTGPHLHFEVIVNGIPQNPERFL